MNRVKWVREAYGPIVPGEKEMSDIIAYHPGTQCRSTAGIEQDIEAENAEGLEPIFCNSCQELLGYYDPKKVPLEAL
jgi:hypothetical protein